MKKIILGVFIIFAVTLLNAQNITVSSLQGTPVDTVLQRHLQGDGVLISGYPAPNIFDVTEHGKFNGQYGNVNSPQIGTFNRNGYTDFPFSKGLIMTTGKVSVAPGPNNNSGLNDPSPSTYIENDLLPYATNTIVNSASLEFDFIAMADEFAFNYIFASEEYPEFACDNFNDVFAFLLSGIDPVTLQTSTTNVAIVPNSVSAAYPNGVQVGVNSINPGPYDPNEAYLCIPPGNPFTQYYVNNPFGSSGIQYDGRTVALTAGAPISSCQKYHMKLAIANLGDNGYDSGVFLEEGSFYSPQVQIDQAWQTQQGGDTLVQNCRNVDLTFHIERPAITTNTHFIIEPITGNTAIMGIDYSLITQNGDTITMLNNNLTIPSGDTMLLVHVKMLPNVQFSNPNQVKEARLHILTQGCDGDANLMPLLQHHDTLILHFRANDSVRLCNTSFTACDTLRYMEVLQQRGSDSLHFTWIPATDITHPDSLATACEITSSRIYKVAAADKWDCMTDTATVEVTIVPRPNIDITYTPAYGCQPLDVTWNAVYTPNYATCLWNIYNDNAFTYSDTDVTVRTTLPDEGYYSAKLIVTSAPGCNDSLTLSNIVHVSPYPHADFYYTPSEPQNGKEVFFTNLSSGSNITGYTWRFGDGSGSSDQSPTHVYHLQESEVLPTQLIVTNADGCTDDTIIYVSVEDHYAFFVPTGFTPNTDGKNEVFLPRVNDVVNYQLMIFSRNGELIFQTTNPDEGWDGTVKGKIVPEGIYIWKISYARIGTPDEMMMKTGTLTVIR